MAKIKCSINPIVQILIEIEEECKSDGRGLLDELYYFVSVEGIYEWSGLSRGTFCTSNPQSFVGHYTAEDAEKIKTWLLGQDIEPEVQEKTEKKDESMGNGKWYLEHKHRLLSGDGFVSHLSEDERIPMKTATTANDGVKAVKEAKALWEEKFMEARTFGCERGIFDPEAVYRIPLPKD
ncbi:MAG: hypothetical protein WCS97_00265 [Candidatus Paceibacterota bacterium]|jgi:hypothetical protein